MGRLSVVLVFAVWAVACSSSPKGSRPDAAAGQPDARAGQPDARAGQPDAAPGQPDAAPGQPDARVVSATGQWVMGYYVGYDIDALPIASIDWSGLTHIIFAPMTLNGNLSINFSFDDSHGTGMQDAMTLATQAHAHGVKALLMLGGAGAGGNIATAAHGTNRPAFVTALVDAMSTLGYDGIDLDWEDSVNLDDLVSLAQDLRAASPSMILTYPGGPINSNIESVDPRMVTLAASLDRFNIQTYYPTTAFAGSGSGWDSWFVAPLSGRTGSTPIAIDDTFNRYHTAGIPNAKLGMGMAFYAICYTNGITGPRQSADATSIVGGDNTYPLSDFFAGGGTFDKSASVERKLDSIASEPYLSLATAVKDPGCENSFTQYISYDDEAAIAAKGAFSKAGGYGGIIIWQIEEGWLPAGAAGGRAQNALFQALKTSFIDP